MDYSIGAKIKSFDFDTTDDWYMEGVVVEEYEYGFKCTTTKIVRDDVEQQVPEGHFFEAPKLGYGTFDKLARTDREGNHLAPDRLVNI